MAVLGEPLDAMVQNLGQANKGYRTVGSSSVKALTQGFRTGQGASGYRLQGIGINIEGSSSRFPDGPTSVSVAVHANSSGKPGAKLVDLVSPTEYAAGHSFFEAPPGTHLAPSTNYVLVWSHLGGTTHRLRKTGSNGQDPGVRPGAFIANAFYQGVDLDNLAEDSDGDALEIAVYTEVNTETVVYISPPPPPIQPPPPPEERRDPLHTERDRRRRRHPQVLRLAARKLPHVRRRPLPAEVTLLSATMTVGTRQVTGPHVTGLGRPWELHRGKPDRPEFHIRREYLRPKINLP